MPIMGKTPVGKLLKPFTANSIPTRILFQLVPKENGRMISSLPIWMPRSPTSCSTMNAIRLIDAACASPETSSIDGHTGNHRANCVILKSVIGVVNSARQTRKGGACDKHGVNRGKIGQGGNESAC